MLFGPIFNGSLKGSGEKLGKINNKARKKGWDQALLSFL